MARVQLLSGRDVVVPQFLGRLDFVLELEQLSADVGAQFVEVALISNEQDAVRRFMRRSAAPLSDGHRDAAALLERLGGVDALLQLYARLLDVVAQRPATFTITTVEGEIEQAYRALVSHLTAPAGLQPPLRKASTSGWRSSSGQDHCPGVGQTVLQIAPATAASHSHERRAVGSRTPIAAGVTC